MSQQMQDVYVEFDPDNLGDVSFSAFVDAVQGTGAQLIGIPDTDNDVVLASCTVGQREAIKELIGFSSERVSLSYLASSPEELLAASLDREEEPV